MLDLSDNLANIPVSIKPKTFHLQWHITEKCNLKCRHCYQTNEYLENELPIEWLFIILDQYVEALKRWGISSNLARISLTGGEPLVRKDLFQLLEKCYENRNYFSYHILTNGSLLDNKIARRFKELDVLGVQISLEGLEKKNDFIRGKGTFNKICNAIKILVDEGIYVNVSMTITKYNLEDVLDVINLCRDLKVNSLGLRRLVLCGMGSQLKDMMLQPLELKNLYKLISEMKSNGLKISTGCENSLWVSEDVNFITHGCSTAYDSMTILPNGDVFPCRRLPIKVGNLIEQPLFDLWYSSDILWKLRNKNNLDVVCKDCKYFKGCLGGARCVAYGYFNNLFVLDPQCWKIFHKLPELTYRKEHVKEEKLLLVKRYLNVNRFCVNSP